VQVLRERASRVRAGGSQVAKLDAQPLDHKCTERVIAGGRLLDPAPLLDLHAQVSQARRERQVQALAAPVHAGARRDQAPGGLTRSLVLAASRRRVLERHVPVGPDAEHQGLVGQAREQVRRHSGDQERSGENVHEARWYRSPGQKRGRNSGGGER